jgi:CRP-like cAMP-binding protein
VVQINNNEAMKLASKVPFFAGLVPSQLRSLLLDGNVVAYREGDRLCLDGDPSAKLFIILAGEVVVVKEGVELARVRPVDIIGEMGVVTGERRCATVMAAQDATVLEIAKANFNLAVSTEPELAARLYRNLLQSSFGKLKLMNEHLAKCDDRGGEFGAVL